MARWIIWSQVIIAFVVLLATLADRGTVSRSMFPPQSVLMFCFFSIPVMPVVAIVIGKQQDDGSGQLVAAVASIGLALATLFAFLPMVQ
ncbi:MAG: hypothetical protein WD847_21875 [Pirellulales bacterium]